MKHSGLGLFNIHINISSSSACLLPSFKGVFFKKEEREGRAKKEKEKLNHSDQNINEMTA